MLNPFSQNQRQRGEVMTNGEKFKEIFEVSQVDEGDYFAFVWFNHNAAEFSIDWWNAPYKVESEAEDESND